MAPLLSVVCLQVVGPAKAEAPRGILEAADTDTGRRAPTGRELREHLPSRGAFRFPPPYNTRAARITNPQDCAGGDCVQPTGYAYWRNMNNHRGADRILVVVGLDVGRGGSGPTLFSYRKSSGRVRKLGPLFTAASPLRHDTAEGWYFSAQQRHALYVNDGRRLLRYDVIDKTSQVVFDIRAWDATGAYIKQLHSSDDDTVHSATLVRGGRHAGCVVYDEPRDNLTFYPAAGPLDECQLGRSGAWLLIKENTDDRQGVDNRIIALDSGEQATLFDAQGAVGHSDNGHGYMVGEDNWHERPGAVRLWHFDGLLDGQLVYHGLSWDVGTTHITHTNADPRLPAAHQYACASHLGPRTIARANELVCFPLDGSRTTLVVAPTMTDPNAAGGNSAYGRAPKANLDPTGRYLFWTSNMGGQRLDAFIVEVPSERLTEPP